MRALVTGGAGFIGSTLTERLLDGGWSVSVVDDLSTGSEANLAGARGRHGFSFQEANVADAATRDLIVRTAPDVIFHLAAQMDVRVSVAEPLFDATVNILGSLRICEAAVAAGVGKVVFAASGGTLYGETDLLPTPEDAPQRPESPYGVAKKSVTDYLHYYRRQRGLDFTALALGNVYGPRQDPHGEAGVVAIFAGLMLANQQPVVFGDGSQTRDFVYVDDVVEAFTLAATRAGGSLLNIGTGVETSVQQVYDTMAREAGFDVPPRYAPPRTGELQRSALDISRAAAELDWRPHTSLASGISRTLDYFRRRATVG